MKQPAQLMAMIYVDSAEDARSFYVDKLGFTHMMGMLGKRRTARFLLRFPLTAHALC